MPEELYVSLLEHWKFDLVAWLGGKVVASPATILSMIRHLPEGCLYVATVQARQELERKRIEKMAEESGEEVTFPEPEISDLDRLIQEKQTWTTVPSLLATGLNRDRLHIMSLYPEKDRPEFPVFGPEAWWPESQKKQQKADEVEEPSTLERFFGKIGANG